MNFKWKHSKILTILIFLFFIGCEALMFEPSIEHTITITSPNGGESFAVGEYMSIYWDSENISKEVQIELYKLGYYYQTIGYVYNDSNEGYHSWYIPTYIEESNYYKIRIIDYFDSNVYGESDYYFTIEEPLPTITITTPDSYTNWDDDNNYYIEWNWTGNISYIKIELYNGSTLWYEIDSYENNYGSYYWDINNFYNHSSSSFRIKITDYYNGDVYDYSDYFTITE